MAKMTIEALSKRVWQPWTRIKEVEFWQWSIENTITAIVANHYPDGSVDDAIAEIEKFARDRADQIAAEIEIKTKELAMWRAVGEEYGSMRAA